MARIPRAGAILVDRVSDWLMECALGRASLPELVQGTAVRVNAVGIPVSRFHISLSVLHPLYRGMALTWRRGEELATDLHDAVPIFAPSRGAGVQINTFVNETTAWRESPFRHMIEHRLPHLRRRLSGPEALLDFPILTEFAAAGHTDYLAFAVPFGEASAAVQQESGGPDGIVGSWTTDRRTGFSEPELTALMRIEPLFAAACRMTVRGHVAENVVATYLGRNAGRRVLSGQIRRGDGETLAAVIWYSDLRGSTKLAETIARERYTSILNSYFECVGSPIVEAGGEILDFIGDAVLAIFPLAGSRSQQSQTAARALAAAQHAFARSAEANVGRRSEDLPELAFGLALHAGDVMFGNIGTPDRLSFSVIGSSVNEVARLEALTKKLGRPLLVSKAFADLLPIGWNDLGQHVVEGVRSPLDVFEPCSRAQEVTNVTS
jgi:adenylate cyclase